MKSAGLDIGSITTKVAIMEDGDILGTRVAFTGYRAETAGSKVLQELLQELKLDMAELAAVVATGYGRNSVRFAHKVVTEITCHAAGARFLYPKVRLVIDVGGQDSKAISLDERGKVRDFVMNDKCAAGTGRFLEVMARALEVDLAAFAELSSKSDRPSPISSLCTVFAESEVISLIAKGEKRENIIAGIHEAMSARVAALACRLGLSEPIAMTGGVARNAGFVAALAKAINKPLLVSPHAQVNGAIGAAVLAMRLFTTFGEDLSEYEKLKK
jgi:predicted CoA-substrate-specific enzyme activase